MKIVINADYGGFGLSDEAMRVYGIKAGLNLVTEGPDQYGFTHFYRDSVDEKNYFCSWDLKRDDLALVETVEEMGEKSWGRYSCLKVIDVPDGVEWVIEENDGREWVAEVHRTWL